MSVRKRCDRCNELLHPDREVWLEHDQRVGKSTNREVPTAYSQGGFPFGKACAAREIKEHSVALLKWEEEHQDIARRNQEDSEK